MNDVKKMVSEINGLLTNEHLSDEFQHKMIALIKELDSNGYNKDTLPVGPALKVEDLSKKAEEHLNDAALEAMKRKAKSQVLRFDDGRTYLSMYFSCRVRKEEIDLGVEKMATIANELADKGLIHSVLAPISFLELAQAPLEYPTVAVFFCPLVPAEEEVGLKAKYSDFSPDAGNVCKPISNVYMPNDLPPGEFMVEARYSPASMHVMDKDSKDHHARVFDTVNEYLKYLPDGTKFLGYRACAISDLSIPYELRFFNPLLTKVKTVDLEQIREVALVDGKVKQFLLTVGIRYYGVDRQELYPFKFC